jgi:hypothetical protein
MRRRNFIATVPLAAASPAFAGDQAAMGASRGAPSPGDNPWTDINAAEVTNLGSVASRNIHVLGAARVLGFGRAPSGTTKVLRFDQELVLTHTPGRLELPNSGADLLISPGDVATAVSLGEGAWVVAAYQPASVFAKIDRRGSQGSRRYKLAIGADAHTTFPDFAVDGAYNRVKTVAKSLILGDPGDTTEIGAIGATGTAAAPAARTGNAPHHINYSYAPQVPLDLQGAPGSATYNGRFAQEYFFQVETPGPRARGGGIAWGVTMPGQVVPYDRMWLRNLGLVLPGRAAFEDSGFSYGYRYGAAPGGPKANFHHIFAPGPVNWGDVPGWGNLSLIAADEATGCALIAIRRNGNLGTGHDWMYSLAADELRLHTVSGDVRTARWGVPVDGGHLLPVAPRTVDLGSPSRPVRAVHADAVDVRRATRGPAAYLESLQPDLDGDVVTLSSAGPSSERFNFLRAVARTSGGHEEPAAVIDGSGRTAIAGALVGEGSSSGAFMEWADGNPNAEDRIGWAVALEGRRIRRAQPGDPAGAIIGVVTARANVVGDAAWRHWSGKHLTDDLGRPQTREVEHVRWSEPVFETREVERSRKVAEAIRQPRIESVEVVERIPRLEEVDGRWVERLVEVRRTVERPATISVPVHDDAGVLVTDEFGAPRMADVPVHEDSEVERTETWREQVKVEVACVDHCYPAHAVPAGIAVPPHAQRFTVSERLPNPAFDASLPYEPRSRRPEWDVVAFCGPELVRKGEVVGDRWILMRRVSDAVEEWLVR